jgi:hypothetical protein
MEPKEDSISEAEHYLVTLTFIVEATNPLEAQIDVLNQEQGIMPMSSSAERIQAE